MSFLYPNTISLSRTALNAATGATSYGGLSAPAKTEIAAGLAAHIQADRQGTRNNAGLPADAAGQSIWKVIFKGARGLASERDVITDEQGKRYQVISADWGPLATTCRCQLLQT